MKLVVEGLGGGKDNKGMILGIFTPYCPICSGLKAETGCSQLTSRCSLGADFTTEKSCK